MSINSDIGAAPTVVGRSQNLRFADVSFDRITMKHFPYTQLDAATLGEARRVLVPGGSISITTGRNADVAALKAGLREAGFDVVRTSRAEGGIPWLRGYTG